MTQATNQGGPNGHDAGRLAETTAPPDGAPAAVPAPDDGTSPGGGSGVPDTAAPVVPPDAASDADAARRASADRAGKFRFRAVAAVAAVGGMLVGGTVEYVVGGALDSTGWFGPTIETVVEQQSANFDEIRAKLDALRDAAPGSPEALALQADIERLVEEQATLTERTHEELRTNQQALEEARAHGLRQTGTATGSDFWLGRGEGITVGHRNNVFALNAINRGYVVVIASGERHNLRPGDFVEFPSADGTYKVFHKHGPAREDGRVGFDLVKPEQPPPAD